MVIRGFLTLLCWVLWASPAWAFPDNGTPLEAFTGTDTTNPPNANWTTATIYACSSGIEIISNAAGSDGGSGNNCAAYWDTTSFNADQEVYTDITVVLGSVRTDVLLRLANIGAGTTDGYAISEIDVSNEVSIYRIDNGVATLLGAAISQTISAGDKLGGTTIGDQICAWFNDGGAGWTEIGCRTDATYSAGGNIGLALNGNTNTAVTDNFGGGNVAAAAGTILQSPPLPMILFQ